MDSLIQLLGSVSAGTVLGWVVAIFLAAVAIYKWVEKYRKARNAYDDMQKSTHQNTIAIENLKKSSIDYKKTNDERFDALEARDAEIIGKIDKIGDSLDQLQEHQKKLEAYQKQKDVAELKDTIQHAYKTYMQRGHGDASKVFITQNEQEILKGLITSYHQAGGNSFIHTKVIPAMQTWEVVTQKEFEERLRDAGD